MTRALAIVLFCCAVAVTATGLVGLYFTTGQRDSGTGLPPETVAFTNEYLEKNHDVVTAMDTHPGAAATYDTLASRWAEDTGWTRATLNRKMAVAFRNESLGLYALQQALQDADDGPAQAQAGFAETLVSEYPDSRAACMALGHLLQGDADGGLARCEAIVQRDVNDRLHRYALLRLGDHHAEQQDFKAAQRVWYAAWMANPEDAPRLHNRLYPVWLRAGAWFAPTILGTEFLDDPALLPLLRRLHEGTAADAPGSARARLRELGPALAASDLAALCPALEALLADWDTLELPAAEKTDYAVALFLIGGARTALSSAPETDILLQNTLNVHRQAFRERALAGLGGLEPRLRAFYTLRIANRQFEAVRPREALETLEDTWLDDSLPQAWRERLLARYTDTLATEGGRPRDAAAAFAAYCDAEPDHPEDYRARAGLLYFRVEAFQEALEQFVTLQEVAETETNRALACYMQGLCHGALGSAVEESDFLEQTVERHARTQFAPEALERLAAIDFARGDREAALARLEAIQARYAAWDGIERVQRMIENYRSGES